MNESKAGAAPKHLDEKHVEARRLSGQLATAFAFPLLADVSPGVTALELYILGFVAARTSDSSKNDTPNSVLSSFERNHVERRDLGLAEVVGAFKQMQKRRLLKCRKLRESGSRDFTEVYTLSDNGDRLLQTIASNLKNDLREFGKATQLKLKEYADARNS